MSLVICDWACTNQCRSRYDLSGKQNHRFEMSYSWTYWAKQKTIDALRFTGLGKDAVTAWEGERALLDRYAGSKLTGWHRNEP